MSYLNRIELIGNLGTDPIVRKKTDSGSFVCLSVATNKKTKDANGKTIQVTHWHTINLNGWLGKYVASSFKKGDKVFIIGELHSTSWEDKKGQIHNTTVIQAYCCELVVKTQQEVNEVVAATENSN